MWLYKIETIIVFVNPTKINLIKILVELSTHLLTILKIYFVFPSALNTGLYLCTQIRLLKFVIANSGHLI